MLLWELTNAVSCNLVNLAAQRDWINDDAKIISYGVALDLGLTVVRLPNQGTVNVTTFLLQQHG